MSKTIVSVIAVVVCLIAVLVAIEQYGDSSAASERERAAQADAQAARDSLEASQAVIDSLDALRAAQDSAYQDSVAVWAGERARLRGDIREEREHHASLADSVRARVDSVTAVLVDRMEESVAVAEAKADSIEADKDAQITALGVRVSTLEATVAEYEEREVQHDAERIAQQSVEDALRSQLRSTKNQRNLAGGVAVVVTALALLGG